MSRSIALRLAVMFAVAALAVFSLVGFALHRVLERQIARHQFDELSTKLGAAELTVRRAVRADRWAHVSEKLDELTPADGSTRFWVFGGDPRFRYGTPLPDRLVISQDARGVGTFVANTGHPPMKTLAATVAANGERPAVRLLVGIDSSPFLHTMQNFAIALVAFSAGGALTVMLLGYWIARVGLRPLARLSREAQSLSPRNLSQRLRLVPLPRELSNLATSFNGALDRLEHSYTQLEAFNADVAHELRTPVTNLIGQTQVALSRERPAPELEEVLQSNLEELERLRGIVNDMLFLARADQGERASGLEKTAIVQEIEKAVEFLDVILEETHTTVRIEGEATAPINVSLFRRAITNLLYNAIQHSAIGAKILVRVSGEKAVRRIAVSNPGQEIAGSDLDRLFDRFYRIDSSRRNSGENHGLGLSIVKAIAGMHGGSVFAESTGGWNTVGFTIFDPSEKSSPLPHS